MTEAMVVAEQRGGWTQDRVELVRRTVVPHGIGTDEFLLFIEQCKRSGLDPLLKEAFCVPRNVKISKKGEPEKWGVKYEFQPSEAGMLARAERFPDHRGVQASAVYAEDEILIDQGKGDVVHKFNPAKRKGSLVGAWARVERVNKLPVVVWLDFGGYVQPTPLWSKIPAIMIEKCARVAALRKAYPEAFGGLYIREEMPAEEFSEEPEEKPKKGEAAMTVFEEKPKALPPPDPMSPEDKAQLQADFALAKEQVEGKKHPLDVIPIGKARGQRISTLDKPRAEQLLKQTSDWLADAKFQQHKDRATMEDIFSALGDRLDALNALPAESAKEASA